jgi:hypothetical protein
LLAAMCLRAALKAPSLDRLFGLASFIGGSPPTSVD